MSCGIRTCVDGDGNENGQKISVGDLCAFDEIEPMKGFLEAGGIENNCKNGHAVAVLMMPS